MTFLAWVSQRCLVVSPVASDDGDWNGYAIGDTEDCVLCDDPECLATVIDWQLDGDEWAGRLADRRAADFAAGAEAAAALVSRPRVRTWSPSECAAQIRASLRRGQLR